MSAPGLPSVSPRPSLDSAVVEDYDISDAPRPITRLGDKSSLRAFGDSSALDLTDAHSGSSLELPHVLTSERIRRRSELSRSRPLDSPPAIEPESIELPIIHEHPQSSGSASVAAAVSTGKKRAVADVSFREDVMLAKDDDVEIAPSFPSSLAPSIRIDEDTDSTAPAISAAQKAVYRRKNIIHFVTLCFAMFLNGWNDGTTGPLLPRIQLYYNVSARIVRDVHEAIS